VIVKSAHVKEETDFVVSIVDATGIVLILHDFIFVSILDFRLTIIIKCRHRIKTCKLTGLDLLN
jgi:hypothetical protein